MDKKMITTGTDLPGYSVVASLGLVRGISVRSLNFFQGFRALWQIIAGGSIGQYTKLCEKTREEAFDQLIKHAQELGANAIINMRYDANEVSAGVTEVLAYGTAVIVEPKK